MPEIARYFGARTHEPQTDEDMMEPNSLFHSYLFIDIVQTVGFFTSAEVAERISEAV